MYPQPCPSLMAPALGQLLKSSHCLLPFSGVPHEIHQFVLWVLPQNMYPSKFPPHPLCSKPPSYITRTTRHSLGLPTFTLTPTIRSQYDWEIFPEDGSDHITPLTSSLPCSGGPPSHLEKRFLSPWFLPSVLSTCMQYYVSRPNPCRFYILSYSNVIPTYTASEFSGAALPIR